MVKVNGRDVLEVSGYQISRETTSHLMAQAIRSREPPEQLPDDCRDSWTIAEFIEELKQWPQDATVYWAHSETDECEPAFTPAYDKKDNSMLLMDRC